MANILITNSVPTEPILRQIPRLSPRWCQHSFSQTNTSNPIDAWVVYDNLLQPESQRIDRNRTMLVTAEPPSIRRYRSVFTSQFGSVRTSHASVLHPHVVRGHEAQPWHYGMHPSQAHQEILDYDALAALSPPPKPKLLSVISSNKIVTEDHRQRLRFVEQLKSAFGDEIAVFGRGIRDMSDKADAIWDYKYHIVLENDHSEFYMSEKLPDSYLGWSFPFYSGGKYADGIFAAGSFGRIDMYDPASSIATIQNYIRSNAFESNRELVAQSRTKVLNELNLFAVLCKAYDSMNERVGSPSKNPPRTILLPKKRSVRLSVRRFMRALSLAA